MTRGERFDSLIRYTCEKYWPEIDWRLVKAQAIAESDLRARVVSPAGAVGLLQLTQAAFDEALPRAMRGLPREDLEANLAAGVGYLRRQYERFPEVSDPIERLWFALAAYNCGRAYVNDALRIYRVALEEQLEAMRMRPVGLDYRWHVVRHHLASARVRGRSPHFRETWSYVERVQTGFRQLTQRRWKWLSHLAPIAPIDPPQSTAISL